MENWFLEILKIVFGLTTCVVGGELLVRGASRLASSLKISPLVIGLTVVAFGTSSPELMVSIQASFSGKADIALGNVVGSNIFNVLFVLGISALIVPMLVSSRLIRWDVPLMIAASVALFLLSLDGRVGRLDGLMLFVGLITYTYWCVRQSRIEERKIKEEYAQEIPEATQNRRSTATHVALVIAGLVFLSLGSHFLVSGSIFVATQMGVSELIIGLTIIAVGTSLPEVVTSIMAALRGKRDIAVGNVVGSNIFNILGVLGLSSALSPTGMEVSTAALRFDIPVMTATAIACLPIFFTGNLIVRWEGGVFIAYYVAYTTYLIMATTQVAASRTFGIIMFAFVIPLTLITLFVCVVRSLKIRRET